MGSFWIWRDDIKFWINEEEEGIEIYIYIFGLGSKLQILLVNQIVKGGILGFGEGDKMSEILGADWKEPKLSEPQMEICFWFWVLAPLFYKAFFLFLLLFWRVITHS